MNETFTLGRENDTLRRRIKRLERRNRRLELSNLELRCEIVFGTSWGLLRFLGVLLVVIGLLFGRASIKLFGPATITSFLRELSQPSPSWTHEFDALEREYFGLGTPRKIKTCKRAKAYYARLSRTELMTNVSKTRVKCLKAELKKKGIETRGLLEDADVVDAYLAAEGRLSRYEASFRPREPALGGDAGSALDKCVKSWGQHNREWCWQLLRYK